MYGTKTVIIKIVSLYACGVYAHVCAFISSLGIICSLRYYADIFKIFFLKKNTPSMQCSIKVTENSRIRNQSIGPSTTLRSMSLLKRCRE